MQHWACMVLGWESSCELQVLLEIKLSLALLREHVSQADGLWESLALKWFLTVA